MFAWRMEGNEEKASQFFAEAIEYGKRHPLGLSTMQLAGGFSEVFDLNNSIVIQLIIISVITVIFITSVVTGIKPE